MGKDVLKRFIIIPSLLLNLFRTGCCRSYVVLWSTRRWPKGNVKCIAEYLYVSGWAGEGVLRWRYIELNVHAFSLPNKDVAVSTKGRCEW